MHAFLKSIVPASARVAIRAKQQDWALRAALRPLRANGSFSESELECFYRAWGNEGFSADKRYLRETIKLIHQHPGHVLECGTGGTTLIAGVLAERFDFEVYSLEQDPAWARAAQRAARYNGLSRVHILNTPLKLSDDYMWYDIRDIELPQRFGVVICDGPYIDQKHGEQVFSNWRYGVLPYLRGSGTGFGAVLLDDVNDPHKRAAPVMDRWQREFGVTCSILSTGEGDLAVIRA